MDILREVCYYPMEEQKLVALDNGNPSSWLAQDIWKVSKLSSITNMMKLIERFTR